VIKAFSGFTLIEVLISLTLLSFILLGFEQVELYSLHETYAAYYVHLAAAQLNSMSAFLHTINNTISIEQPMAIWNAQNKELLPNGEGSVRGVYPRYTMTIYWGHLSHACQTIQLGTAGCIQKNILIS